MADDVIGSVTGTATFDRVEIEADKQEERTLVVGYYGEYTTTYGVPDGDLIFHGIEVDLDAGASLTLAPINDKFITVEATEDNLIIDPQ